MSGLPTDLVVAAGATAGALALVRPVPASARTPPGSLADAHRPRAGSLLLAGAVTLGLVVLVGGLRVAVLALVAAGALAGGVRLRALRRERARRAVHVIRVLELCEGLAADLTAGGPPGPLVEQAARSWPLLEPVATAVRLGADVPRAWRELAATPGLEGLAVVAGAWEVSHRTGAGLATALERVAESLRAAQATRRVVVGELASARSTARLMAGLPVLALLMGSGAGGNPWAFLVATPIGLGCLAGGLAFELVGLAWIESIARSVESG